MTELESQVRDVLSRLLPEVPATDRAPLVDAYIARRARAEQDPMERLWARLRPPSNEVPGLAGTEPRARPQRQHRRRPDPDRRLQQRATTARQYVGTTGATRTAAADPARICGEDGYISCLSAADLPDLERGPRHHPHRHAVRSQLVTDSCRSAAARHFRRPRVRRPAARRTVADSSPAPDFARRDLQLARAEPVRDNNRSTRGGARGGGPDHTNAVAWHLGCRRADGPSRSVYRTPRQPNSQPCR